MRKGQLFIHGKGAQTRWEPAAPSYRLRSMLSYASWPVPKITVSLLAVVAVGCASTSSPEARTSRDNSPTATSIAAPLVQSSVVPVSAVELDEPEIDYGPLAVSFVKPDASVMEASFDSVLEIDGDCVYVENEGGRVLVLWDYRSVAWRTEDQTLLLRNGLGEFREFRDGDEISFGGGYLPQEAIRNITAIPPVYVDWLAEPNRSCDFRAVWMASVSGY